jgi:predicted Zn-dependent protease
VRILVDATGRLGAEDGGGPFTLGADEALGIRRTKLGLRVVDDRVTISHDPTDPELGLPPKPGLAPITWIENGVLKTLSNDRERHSLPRLNEHLPSLHRASFRMAGGTTSMEEMIRTTRRGLLVTRLSNVRVLDRNSLLATGLTRDGLWLIENGKITKPVKNFRFTESPLFALNNVEQLGPAVPVFNANGFAPVPIIVPPIKTRDFSFTAMVDAV